MSGGAGWVGTALILASGYDLARGRRPQTSDMARAVLIDDEERLLATLARFLERRGLEVVKGNSFAEVQEHLRPGRFEVLITDIVMPDYDGIRVLHEVVEARKCQEPVILITGDPSLDTASAAVRSGAFDYIQKPVTEDRLAEVVDRGLRHVRLLRERDEAQRRELQLLKSLAEIGESASVLSHEIRTPITGLRHALSAVGDKLGIQEGVVIDDFVGSLARIERLLGATLSFARPLTLRLAPASLRDVAVRAVDASQAHPLFASMRVKVKVDPDLHVTMDGELLSEVFENLLRNAAEACGGDGVVRIEAARRSADVSIDVVDDGPGIPQNRRADAFKPFQSYKQAGTGIGLAFARKVVEAHGATISLVDTERGARFRIVLPDRLRVESAER